jgi:hypothetical protein
MILKVQHNKIMKKILSTLICVLMLVPGVIFAAPGVTGGGDPSVTGDVCSQTISLTTLGNIINWASCTLIKSVVPFLITLAVVGFIWGMIQYFLNPENEEKRKAGKSFMLWGIISLFAIVSMWGLVGVLSNTFGVKTLLPQLSQ